jgi:hypothetical protein
MAGMKDIKVRMCKTSYNLEEIKAFNEAMGGTWKSIGYLTGLF